MKLEPKPTTSMPARIILSVEAAPWFILWRVGFGYGIFAFSSHFLPPRPTIWQVIGFLILALIALRLACMAVRIVLPFPKTLKTAWAERRALAKRFDSYQWRKLFGIGLGCLLWAWTSGGAQREHIIVAILSTVSGLIGLVVWSRVLKLYFRPRKDTKEKKDTGGSVLQQPAG